MFFSADVAVVVAVVVLLLLLLLLMMFSLLLSYHRLPHGGSAVGLRWHPSTQDGHQARVVVERPQHRQSAWPRSHVS
jgi:hypothetical protein